MYNMHRRVYQQAQTASQITDLPDELLIHVSCLLEAKDVCSVRLVNRRLLNATIDVFGHYLNTVYTNLSQRSLLGLQELSETFGKYIIDWSLSLGTSLAASSEGATKSPGSVTRVA